MQRPARASAARRTDKKSYREIRAAYICESGNSIPASAQEIPGLGRAQPRFRIFPLQGSFAPDTRRKLAVFFFRLGVKLERFVWHVRLLRREHLASFALHFHHGTVFTLPDSISSARRATSCCHATSVSRSNPNPSSKLSIREAAKAPRSSGGRAMAFFRISSTSGEMQGF